MQNVLTINTKSLVQDMFAFSVCTQHWSVRGFV